MMKPPAWLRSDTADAIEVHIPNAGVLLVIVGIGGRSGAMAALLSPGSVDGFQQHPETFGDWIASATTQGGARPTFRLIGNERKFSALTSLLSRLGFRSGKHVPIQSASQTMIHFFPGDGRIRMPRGATPDGRVVIAKKSPAKSKKTKVLVVDDSETIRKLLSRILNEDPEIECVATVDVPSKVDEAIIKFCPDVITLDIHMPEMDGVTLLKKLLSKYSIPTVMISALSKEDGTFVFEALEAGAVDYIQKPSISELKMHAPVICEKIRAARFARVRKQPASQGRSIARPAVLSSDGVDFSFLIGIGSSTGGTEALKTILTRLPEKIPPILIVQHIPPVFSKAFAERMNQLCPFEVKEAEDGESVTENKVLIAPGGRQMKVGLKNGLLHVIIDDSDPVNRHRPSVDVLFDSIALLQRKKVVAAILTGMGADGAKGLLKLRQGGAHTFAQDEATSVIYGMPKEAAKLGGAEKIVPLDQVASSILKACMSRRRNSVA